MEMNTLKVERLVILHVEDDDAHAELVKRSFSENRVENTIFRAIDGQDALDFLQHKGKYEADPPPRPTLILLDLQIPKIDGLQVLKQIKESENFRTIPVVILTTSAADRDMLTAYNSYVNSYLLKPVDFDGFSTVMDEIGFYWSAVNRSFFGAPTEISSHDAQ
jgi:CheY-like chemotaxis protein